MVIIVVIMLFFVPIEIEKINLGPFGDRNPTYILREHSSLFSLEGNIIYLRLLTYLLVPGLFLFLINKLFSK
jgi:hypothetical protein